MHADRRALLLACGAALLRWPLAAHAQAASAADTSPVKVPTYHTALPPPMRWGYRLQRGSMSGSGELSWAPSQGRYEAHLEGRVIGISVLDWSSRGLLDATGLAPERYVVRRIGRSAQSADFQRAAGKISFTGESAQVPLLPGTQDRLSWMLQLPGIVAAAPQRFQRGAQVQMFIVGARADADVWTFSVIGSEAVDTPSGRLNALRLMREPRKARDMRAEIWLDPARHYLPAKALLANAGADDGDALELLLQTTTP
jgi:Protein of unknown function (DUF3108)